MQKDILQIIKEDTLKRVALQERKVPFDNVVELAKNSTSGKGKFKDALKKSGVSLICEIKKASPSKGVIDPEFKYMDILQDYKNGADCLSVLTEPNFFLGSDTIFANIRKDTTLPMLRKDFTATVYQIYESKVMGADAILLICAMLQKQELKEFYDIAKSLELDVLVETHTSDELAVALEIGADIIGVNSRNLKNFDVSLDNGLGLISGLSKNSDKVFVAESGIFTDSDIAKAKQSGADAVLVGESLMRSDNRVQLLKSFKKAGEL